MGLELFVFDAWRPQAVQRFFHDVWFPEWLRVRRPGLSGEDLQREVETYWSAPSSGAGSPSPHSTGGAVDLTLVWRGSQHPLHMGTLFDDVTEMAWTDWFERSPTRSMSDEEARDNRRLLHGVMTDAGFCNNPSEWWHYSWGDQMWARLTGADAAMLGSCDPTEQGPA
jgi:D-alanyl-D-alanine dipeptidase